MGFLWHLQNDTLHYAKHLRRKEPQMSNADLIDLYSGQILKLAADIPHLGRLDAPMATAKVRSPLCGSTVTVDIIVADGQITSFAQDVKACALGQASAAVIGAAIMGQDRAAIQRGRDELHAMLNGGAAPTAPWDGLHVLAPAAEYRNRHASILLCFDATLAALDTLS